MQPNYGQDACVARKAIHFEIEKEHLLSPHVDGVLRSCGRI